MKPLAPVIRTVPLITAAPSSCRRRRRPSRTSRGATCPVTSAEMSSSARLPNETSAPELDPAAIARALADDARPLVDGAVGRPARGRGPSDRRRARVMHAEDALLGRGHDDLALVLLRPDAEGRVLGRDALAREIAGRPAWGCRAAWPSVAGAPVLAATASTTIAAGAAADARGRRRWCRAGRSSRPSWPRETPRTLHALRRCLMRWNDHSARLARGRRRELGEQRRRRRPRRATFCGLSSGLPGGGKGRWTQVAPLDREQHRRPPVGHRRRSSRRWGA